MPAKTEPPLTPGFKVIGVLESCYREKFGTPRQPHLVPGSFARLKICPQYAPEHSLQGLSEFSHVWLLSWFHLATNKTFHPKIHPPRLKGGKIGVFATRTPHRPNPVGLSLVKLVRVEKDTLYLSGIDLVNGTPILDVKPYLPISDIAADPRSGWVPHNAFPELKVDFTPEALKDIAGFAGDGARDLPALIADTLRHDPRNMRDKTQMKDGAELAFFMLNMEIKFSVSGDKAVVLGVDAAINFNKKFRRSGPASPRG